MSNLFFTSVKLYLWFVALSYLTVEVFSWKINASCDFPWPHRDDRWNKCFTANSSYVIFALYLPPCETSSFFHGDENFKVVYQNEFIFKKYKLIWGVIVSGISDSLCEKCPNTEFFWSLFTRTRTKYRDLLHKSHYSVRIRENTDQKNSIFKQISCSDSFSYS